MPKTVLTFLLFIFFSVLGKNEILPEDTVKTTFKNPLWDGADPWMIKHGDEYMYCFSSKNSIVVSRSKFITKKRRVKINLECSCNRVEQ